MAKNPVRNYAIEYVGKGGRSDDEISAIAATAIADAAEPEGDPIGDQVDQPDVGGIPFPEDLADGDGIVYSEADGTFLARRLLAAAGGEGHELETIAISGDAVEIDWSLANRFDVTLTDDPDITFAGLPAFGAGAEIGVTFRQDATGGRAIASWPASVAWYNPATGLDDGDPPTIPTDPGASLFVVLSTGDGGVNVGGSYPTVAAAALDDLTDVAVTSPTLGDRLRFDGSTWRNSPLFHHNLTGFDGTNWSVLFDGDGNCLYAEG